jgi:hypothetical protein
LSHPTILTTRPLSSARNADLTISSALRTWELPEEALVVRKKAQLGFRGAGTQSQALLGVGYRVILISQP